MLQGYKGQLRYIKGFMIAIYNMTTWVSHNWKNATKNMKEEHLECCKANPGEKVEQEQKSMGSGTTTQPCDSYKEPPHHARR